MLQPICTKAREKKVSFLLFQSATAEFTYFCGHLWRKTMLLGSEHSPYTESQFFSEPYKAVCFRLLRGKTTNKTCGQELCNQASRYRCIFIVYKLCSNFHHYFKSFHLLLAHTEHHQAVPVMQLRCLRLVLQLVGAV